MSKQPVPFHEGLPEFIRNASPITLACLATIIKRTKIPIKVIPEIEELWIAKCREIRMGTPNKELLAFVPKNGKPGKVLKVNGEDYFGVPEALREQKILAEEATKEREIRTEEEFRRLVPFPDDPHERM